MPAQSAQIQSPPAGWKAFTPSPLAVSAAGLMGGPPDLIADLIADLTPDSVAERSNGSSVPWRFDHGPLNDGLWLSCGGGDGGQITLSQRISHRFTQLRHGLQQGRPHRLKGGRDPMRMSGRTVSGGGLRPPSRWRRVRPGPPQ